MSYQKFVEDNPHNSKTLVKIMKMAYNPPDKTPYESQDLSEEEKKAICKINEITVVLLQIKYLFIAFKYSINTLIQGKKIINAPNTLDGFNALVSVYSHKLSPGIIAAMKNIITEEDYWEMKKISAINSAMYLTIINDIDSDKLEKDLQTFLALFKKYFSEVLIARP